mmetsp:Transcript_109268/g.319880  ORF Transcript_109268/g.319880 Transcript_109268/m.319880 type:complete len:286 (+) Transcript_109268:124-981(+)
MQGPAHTVTAGMSRVPLPAAPLRAFQPPPGLSLPPPPGLDLPLPPGLDLPTTHAARAARPSHDDVDFGYLLGTKLNLMRLQETKDYDSWESDHSTAEPSEAFASLSRTSSSEKVLSLPQTPGQRCLPSPLESPAGSGAPLALGSKQGVVLKLEDALVQSSMRRVPGSALPSHSPAIGEPREAVQSARVLDLLGALGRGDSLAPSPPPPPPPRCDTMHKLPSVGSALHGTGQCRPCDFMYRTDNCREGAACRFCHLCGPQAVRLRRKQRRALLRSGRQATAISANP